MNTMGDSPMDAADTEDQSPVVTKPPDGGYGWVCVAACFIINCFTWGVIAVRLVYIHVQPNQLRHTSFSYIANC